MLRIPNERNPHPAPSQERLSTLSDRVLDDLITLVIDETLSPERRQLAGVPSLAELEAERERRRDAQQPTLGPGEWVVIHSLGLHDDPAITWGGIVETVDTTAIRLIAVWIRIGRRRAVADDRRLVVPWTQVAHVEVLGNNLSLVEAAS